MQKSHRIRTTVGTDKNIRVNINQDFDFLEILSLKLRQEDVYARFCADYGVVAGRVITNGGYGVPNVNVSIFVPLSNMDQDDEVISTLYPYKKPTDKNEDGYRYNLLPYVQEYGGHTPTGTFPDRTDILERKEVLEVYEKYYRYTVKTNDSGDFMIVGVPLGMQIITMDLDLSNIGCFSLRPSDLIRMGIGAAEQFNGPLFKSSNDLSSLPQLLFGTKDIEVTSFWGEKDLCNVGITRTDFDLRDYGIEIKPQSVFMGSMFSTSDEDFLKTNCKPKKSTGKLCDLVTGPGEVLAIRQTIDFDSNGRPVLEEFSLPEGGKIVDDEGTWLVDLPMNMDYVVTNEFGDQVISNDPKVGIPTTGKYRFRIKYQNEGGIDNDILRADYLVPNIREYGWLPNNNNDGPYNFSAAQLLQQKKSYAFSLDWNDYADPISAINCEDTFYKFNHNKVYTIANFLDRWKWGANRDKHLGIKEINDRSCTSKINRFPTNDAIKNFDFLVFLFNIIIALLTPTIFALIIILHVLALLYPIFRIIINMFIWLINLFYDFLCALSKIEILNWYPFDRWSSYCSKPNIEPLSKENPFKKIPLPMISYPDCEACPCEDAGLEEQSSPTQTSLNSTIQNSNVSFLADVNYTGSYGFKFSSDDNIKQSFNQLFAGFYEKTPQCLSQLYRLPVAKVPTNKYYLGFDVTLAQSMNLLNVKFSYFANSAGVGAYPKLGGSIITYKTTNQNPTTNAVEPSDDIYDQPLIILCDAGTLNQITPGLLLSFYNPTNIPDPNMTGLTIANQFNTNAITGSTPFNTTALVNRPITFIKPDGTVVNTTIKCKITDSEKPYSHTAGVEYFQLITGGTVASFRSLVTTSTGPLYNYIFNKKQSIAYPSSSPTLIGQNSLTNYNSNETLEILILTRGVDPYTQKQKIKYDLSSLFGHAVNSANVTVEGEYYLNIPIQPNTGLLLSNSTWRNDEYSPESHNITNNTNISLYHEPFGFNVDTTLFSAFTSNNPHYYNSTDKSQSTFTSYPLPSSCEAKKLGDYTVNGEGYESSPATASSNKNTMLFEYTDTPAALIYSQNFSASYPTGWWSYNWDLTNLYNSCTSTYSMGIQISAPGAFNLAFTKGINMVAGKSYKMKFKQNTDAFGPQKHKLRIGVTNAQSLVPTVVQQILNLINLNNTTCIDRVTNDFNCTTSGVYFFMFECYSNPGSGRLIIDDVEIYEFVPSYITQGRIEGGSFMASGIQTPGFYTNGKELSATSTVENQARLYSPAYHMAAPNDITMTNNNRMVFRSDRLPTSDKPQMKGNSSLSLHLNDNFAYYVINEDGTAISFTMTTTAADSSNDSADAGEDGNNFTTKVIESFDCQGMTALGCYTGVGTAFQKIEDCSKENSNNNLGNPDNKRVNGGCYYLVQSPLLVSIPKDIRYFAEWKSRFRMMFAACRGVFAEMFQNNWVNGTLYMFSFKKRTVYSAIGQPKSYKFCGAIINNPRKGLGPIIYTEGTTNSLFYRSTPYDGTNFLGQMPERQTLPNTWSIPEIYSTNRRNLYFPTTIMDLGSRDQFTKEVCFNPQLESVYVDTLLSTSNQDTSDILQLGIISRLINSNFWGQIAGLGDGSVNRMFSREDNRLDGDIVQLYSINSEYGVAAFSEDEYVGSGDIYVNAETNGNSVVGIFFSSDTKNRKVLSPGITVLGPGLSNYFGYPDTQEVPMYKWRSSVTTTIFGDQDNDWYTDYEVTNSNMYSTKYQGMDFTQTDYFHVNNGNNLGYIYNYAADGVTPIASWPSGNNQKFVVGAPNHFYFGLNKGKSAINRYITKYILNRNE